MRSCSRCALIAEENLRYGRFLTLRRGPVRQVSNGKKILLKRNYKTLNMYYKKDGERGGESMGIIELTFIYSSLG